MDEIMMRNSLKSWAKEVTNKLLKMNKNNYVIYKEFIIRIFATILLCKFSDSKLKSYSKEEIEENYIWNKVQDLYKINDLLYLHLKDIDDNFFDNTIKFLASFCDKNDSCLDSILAWLYQYLNINEIDNKNKDTQFFTDKYMVEFLVEKSIKELSAKNNINMQCIDPACGGGNFIITLIEQLYHVLNLNNDEFIEFIEKNIFGYDIDKNLSIICIINIYIKLLELRVLKIDSLFKGKFSIYYDENNKFGSLLKVDSANSHMIFRAIDKNKVRYGDVFNNRYSLVITNPPFKGRREQDYEIREYIKKNYINSKGDICNSFFERVYDLLNNCGIASFVMQNGWMYLESYKELREYMLNNGSILSIVDLGADSFYDLSGEKANIALLVYLNKKMYDKFNVYSFKQYKYEEKINRLKNINCTNENEYELVVNDILNDEEYRIEYLSSGNIRNAFKVLDSYSNFAKPMQGTSTGDNKKFVKYHWEVEKDNRWCLVSKGGGYCKWAGLNIYKVKWGDNGEEIANYPNSALRNIQYFDSTDLVYSDTGTSGLSVRLLRKDQIFIASGPGICIKEGDKYCHLAFLNSRLASYYIKVLTPKLTISPKYIGKIPVIKDIFYDEDISQKAKLIVDLKQRFNKKRPTNYEYVADEFLEYDSIYEYAKRDFINDLELELERLRYEKEINDKVLSYYDFTLKEISHIYSKVGINPYEIKNILYSFDIDEMDKLIEKILDNSCCVRSIRDNKETLGVEGILEYLAVNKGMNVRQVFLFIKDNIDKFNRVLLKYYKHTLHRIKLLQIGYLNSNKEIVNDRVISNIILKDKKIYNIKLNEKLWFKKDLYLWHSKTFFNKPILISGDSDE